MDLRHNHPVANWLLVCRESFDLQPAQLATLAAIVAFHAVEGEPVPLAELHRVSAKPECRGMYRIDADLTAELYRMGLVSRVKRGREWFVAPTVRGMRRVRQ